MLVSLYFKNFREASFKYYLGIGIAVNVVAVAGVYFMLPESPEYLYSLYRYPESKKAFAMIAAINKAPMGEYTFDAEDDQKKLSFIDITAQSDLKTAYLKQT